MVLGSDMRNLIKKLKATYTNEEIAQMLECDVNSVETCIKNCELLDNKKITLKLPTLTIIPNGSNKREVGRPKVFDNRKLVEKLLCEHPHFTSIDVQRELLNQYGIEVSRRTLQRRISEIKAKQSAQANIGGLSASVRQQRLQWAHAHEDWTVQDWRRVFNMYDYKAVEGSAPKQIYVDSLTGPDYPECKDLNLLEQLMAILEPKVQLHAPNTNYEFRLALYDVWHSNQDIVDKIEDLYQKMAWRVAAVIQNGGGETD